MMFYIPKYSAFLYILDNIIRIKCNSYIYITYNVYITYKDIHIYLRRLTLFENLCYNPYI